MFKSEDNDCIICYENLEENNYLENVCKNCNYIVCLQCYKEYSDKFNEDKCIICKNELFVEEGLTVPINQLDQVDHVNQQPTNNHKIIKLLLKILLFVVGVAVIIISVKFFIN
jgi:hypothetical protein